MHRQERDLPLEGMAVYIGLLHGPFHRDDDIPQHRGARLLIDVVLAVLPQRKTEHIGGLVFIPVLLVQLLDLGVVHKSDADLGRALEMLSLQHRVARAADEDAQPGRHLHRVLLVGDIYFMRHQKHILYFLFLAACALS